MKSSGFVRDPFSRALALSLVLHILLLFFLDRYEPRRKAVELQENHAVEVGLLSLENREDYPPADISPDEPEEQNMPNPPSVQPPPENAAPAEVETVETAAETVPEPDDSSAVLPPENQPAPVSEEADPAEAGQIEAVSSEPAAEVPSASFSTARETDLQPVARESAGPPGLTGTSLDEVDFSGARTPAPAYPSMAKQMEWEGDVTVSFTINRKGRAEDVVIDRSSGHEVLDQAVVTTVKKRWRFPRRDDSLRVWKTFSFRLL